MALYHTAKGTETYTIVGNPTIVDNVVSGFSGNDYLNITSENAIPLSNLNSYTTRVSFTTGNSLAVIEQIIGSTNAFFGFRQATGPQGSLRAVVFDVRNGLFKDLLVTTSLRINTSYIAEQVSNQEECYVRFSADGGVTWTRVDTEGVSSYSISFQTINIGSGTFGAFSGSIDLNNTYITVNGQPWFGICPVEVKKHQIMGPVGYTVTGSPTIMDGIASGFSNSNYLQISQTYNATNDKNVEIYVRAKTPTTISSSFNPIFGADNVGFWGISAYTNALFAIRMGYANGTSLDFGNMYISGGVQADTWYRFKITGSNGIWRAEIYNDSGTLLKSSDRDWTSNTLNANYTIKLKCTDNTNTYSGSIDLNETYIKVNGKLWYWQPRETERIIVNGVEVWTKPVITHGYTLTATRGTYAYTSQTFDLHNASSWSYNTRYKYLVAGQAGGQWLFGNSNGYYTGPMLLITSQNRLATYLSSTGSGFNIAQEKQLTDMTFEVNKEYLISLLYTDVDGYNFKVTDIATGHIYNFNVSTNTAHINNTAPTYLMNNMGGLTNSYNQGIMYLADTTIIVDGVKVFNGATAEIGVDLINNGLTIGEE